MLLAQSDTIVKKRQIDSLESEIFRYKDSTRRLLYIVRTNAYTKKIDTLYHNADSSEVLYRSSSGKLIKRVFQRYRGHDCVNYEITQYMNDISKPEFVIYFDRPCFTKEEVINEEEMMFEKLSFYYERLMYDSVGRLSKRIFWYPKMSIREFNYTYDSKGNERVANKSIDKRNFWD
jgi:hypothetical protein